MEVTGSTSDEVTIRLTGSEALVLSEALSSMEQGDSLAMIHNGDPATRRVLPTLAQTRTPIRGPNCGSALDRTSVRLAVSVRLETARRCEIGPQQRAVDDVTTEMERADFEALRPVLAEAGFADLDSFVLARFLCFFAEALREAPLEDFGDVNARIGTANGLGSGMVSTRMDELAKLGYLAVSPNRAVHLTRRGANAARLVGVPVD